MVLYSDANCHYSHRIRIVLAEKSITVEIIDVDGSDRQVVAEINPYNSLPTLLDRDLVLYESKVMMEYLEERFPHPPLLPVNPVARGLSRQLMHRIERDWCVLVDRILRDDTSKTAGQARKKLRESLVSIAPIFAEKTFFMSEEFSLVDCCMAPLLWRLPQLGVELPVTKQSMPLIEYRDTLFSRDSFQASLSGKECNMRDVPRLLQ